MNLALVPSKLRLKAPDFGVYSGRPNDILLVFETSGLIMIR